MKTLNKFLPLIFSFCFLTQGLSQEIQTDSTANEKTYYLIKKSDGNEFYGYILSDDGREILVQTKNIGKIYINKSDLKEIIDLNKSNIENFGEFRETGPFTTRYYFTNNALPVKKGEDYAMLNLYGPEVHFSLSDNFSLGIMSTWIASPFALAAKYSFNSKGKTHLAIGTIMGTSGYIEQAGVNGGLHWLTITRGDRKSNFSVSAGYGYIYDNANLFYNNLGNKYSWQDDDPSQPYFVHPKIGDNTIRNTLYGNSNYYDNNFIQSKFHDAVFIGIGGITPIGKKASFIFDSMIILDKKEKVEYSPYEINVDYDNGNSIVNETYTIGKGEVVEKGFNTTIIFMPSMRFNKSYDKAFQIALAGVINIDDSGDATSFPAPMVSWLRKF
ncbi:MAG: hypothetical protein P8M12_09615 [Flavobacteriales bacterium]|nr:hypothetical protein [Flavobacteriales bacterium]